MGHRIQEMGGFINPPKLQFYIKQKIRDILSNVPKNTVVLTSLALGIELWAGEIAHEYGIPFHLYVPFEHHYAKWPLQARQIYTDLSKHKKKQILISTAKSYDIKYIIEKDLKLVQDSDTIYTFYRDLPPILKKTEAQIINSLPSGEEDDWFIPI